MQKQGHSAFAWLLFIALCLIWGSSFILMKLGMFTADHSTALSANQVAAIRILSASLALLLFAPGAWKRLPSAGTGGYIFLSGLLGSFFPAFLFCLAESKIDSSLAGTINAVTPIFTLLIATLFFKSKIALHKWIGIAVGFAGCLLLFIGKGEAKNASFSYGAYAVLATVCYGINVNMVRHRLMLVPSLDIAALAFSFLLLPSLVVLYFSGFFQLPLHDAPYRGAILASATLGVIGTALASILFYILVKRAGIVFASLVTYGIPFVALGWGILYGEKIATTQMIALLIILSGVYLANQNLVSFFRRNKKEIPPANEAAGHD
jgi:drug/metabolite transporter (DMT)-like permease